MNTMKFERWVRFWLKHFVDDEYWTSMLLWRCIEHWAVPVPSETSLFTLRHALTAYSQTIILAGLRWSCWKALWIVRDRIQTKFQLNEILHFFEWQVVIKSKIIALFVLEIEWATCTNDTGKHPSSTQQKLILHFTCIYAKCEHWRVNLYKFYVENFTLQQSTA